MNKKPLKLSIDPAIPWRIRGPKGERIADCSSSLTAGALLSTYNTAHAAVAALKEADAVIEEWIGILKANGLRHSAIDGEAVRTKIAALLPNSLP